MFFLLRMAFWLGLVLVLLPREKTPESDKVPQIGASEAVSAATATVSDMGQFCKRQPAACEVGGQAATAIGQRAQDGARQLYKIITKPDQPSVPNKKPDHTSSIGIGRRRRGRGRAAHGGADGRRYGDRMAAAADAAGLKIACGTGSISVAFVRSASYIGL